MEVAYVAWRGDWLVDEDEVAGTEAEEWRDSAIVGRGGGMGGCGDRGGEDGGEMKGRVGEAVCKGIEVCWGSGGEEDGVG